MKRLFLLLLFVTLPIAAFAKYDPLSQKARESYYQSIKNTNRTCYAEALRMVLAGRHYCLENGLGCAFVFTNGFPILSYRTDNVPIYGLELSQKKAFTSAVFFIPTRYLWAASKRNDPFYGYNHMEFDSHYLSFIPGGFWVKPPSCTQNKNGLGLGISTSLRGQLFYPSHGSSEMHLYQLMKKAYGQTQYKISDLLNPKTHKTSYFNDLLLYSLNWGRGLCKKTGSYCTIVFATTTGQIDGAVSYGWQNHLFAQVAEDRAMSTAIGATNSKFHTFRTLNSPSNLYAQFVPGGKPVVIDGRIVGAIGVASYAEWAAPASFHYQSVETKIAHFIETHYIPR